MSPWATLDEARCVKMRQCSASRGAEGPEVHQNRHQKHAGEARGPARNGPSGGVAFWPIADRQLTASIDQCGQSEMGGRQSWRSVLIRRIHRQ